MPLRVELHPGQVARAIRQRNRANINAMIDGAIAGAFRGRKFIVRKTPRDQGQLRKSWKVKAGRRAFILRDSLAAELINDAPHAGVVERGARPHPVSREGFLALVGWAKRHGFKGARRKFQRGGRSRIQGPKQETRLYGIVFADQDVLAARVAMGIVRKLRAHGQVGTFFVKKHLPELERRNWLEVKKALRAISKKQVEI